MSSQSHSSLPFDHQKLFGNSAYGRFGLKVSGFNSPHNSIHGIGMNGAWQGFGIGRGSVSDLATYRMGGGVTLGSLAGPGASHKAMLKAVERQFATMTDNKARAGLAARLGGAAAVRSIPIAFGISATYSGYQEGGTLGAIKGLAISTAGNYIGDVILQKVLPNALRAFPVVAAAAAVGYLGHKSLEGGAQATRRRRKMEMGGSPIVDPFGNAGTMRQRSLQALTTSQLNGRSAFGSEAQLMHVPVMR